MSYVYVMSNSSITGTQGHPLFKIGYTDSDPQTRAKELSLATGVAKPFIVTGYYRVIDGYKVEQRVHKILEQYRVNANREFFECYTMDIHNAVLEAVADLDDAVAPNSQPVYIANDDDEYEYVGYDDLVCDPEVVLDDETPTERILRERKEAMAERQRAEAKQAEYERREKAALDELARLDGYAHHAHKLACLKDEEWNKTKRYPWSSYNV